MRKSTFIFLPQQFNNDFKIDFVFDFRNNSDNVDITNQSLQFCYDQLKQTISSNPFKLEEVSNLTCCPNSEFSCNSQKVTVDALSAVLDKSCVVGHVDSAVSVLDLKAIQASFHVDVECVLFVTSQVFAE